MTDNDYKPVAVSRRICAPAHDIFQILANLSGIWSSMVQGWG